MINKICLNCKKEFIISKSHKNQIYCNRNCYILSNNFPPNKNKKHNNITKEKISKSCIGRIPWNKGKKWNKDILVKIIQGLSKRPTSYEKKIIYLIKKYNLPYKYVGDGSLLIGYKNPDFVNINGFKICIEIYENFFKKKFYNSCKNYEKQRNKTFSKYGYKTLFLNTYDIKNKNWEKICLNKIKNFENYNSHQENGG